MAVNFENIEGKLQRLVHTSQWKVISGIFREKQIIFMFGHGGNMGVTVHLAADIARLTNKTTFSPGSGILVTSFISANNYSQWLTEWLTGALAHIDHTKVMAIGCSCSHGTTSNQTILNALRYTSSKGIPSIIFCAKPNTTPIAPVIELNTDCIYYHSAEALYMMLFYQLIYDFNQGNPEIPVISNDVQCLTCDNDDYDHSFCATEETKQEVPPGFEAELKNLAIDFDGVLHNFDKGFHDGTCYGDPIPGASIAVTQLSKRYNIIVYSAKCRQDRPLVHGKTGKQLVIEWLSKHNLLHCVKEITAEKPRAQYYIDDKAIEFHNNWDEICHRLLS